MSLSVKIPIIKSKKSLLQRFLAYVFFISVSIFFLIILFDSFNTLTIITLILVFASGILMNFFDPFLIDGYLILYNDHIEIKTNEMELNLLVKDLATLRFKFNGFQGDVTISNIRSIPNKNGTGNYLILKYDEAYYKLELHLEKHYFDLLNSIFTHWKEINPRFIIVGEYGIKIKSL